MVRVFWSTLQVSLPKEDCMDTPEKTEQPAIPSRSDDTGPATATSPIGRSITRLIPQACVNCDGAGIDSSDHDATESYIYALGRVEARFPRPSVEKEFAQAIGRSGTSGQTDREAFHMVLSQRENRYLVRQLCWVLTIQGLETYLLQPRDPADFDSLVETTRPTPNPLDIDAVIGLRGPLAPPEMCNGLIIPVVAFDQIYSFDRASLIAAIPRPEKAVAKAFKAAAEELFDRVMQLTDNVGATDDHRALNYLAMRYPTIYTTVGDAYARNASLNGVEVRPSRLSGTRKIADVIFSFTGRNNDFTEKFFVRVDVTEEFPFLVNKMSPYFDR
jgi:hypothetical protein